MAINSVRNHGYFLQLKVWKACKMRNSVAVVGVAIARVLIQHENKHDIFLPCIHGRAQIKLNHHWIYFFSMYRKMGKLKNWQRAQRVKRSLQKYVVWWSCSYTQLITKKHFSANWKRKILSLIYRQGFTLFERKLISIDNAQREQQWNYHENMSKLRWWLVNRNLI